VHRRFIGYVGYPVDVGRSSQLFGRVGYARGICEGSAVHAGELALCVGRICVPSAEGAYALALLAIGALRESLSLSSKIKPGR
jgi:hypothetical protein